MSATHRTHVIVNTGTETILDAHLESRELVGLMSQLLEQSDEGLLVLIDGEALPAMEARLKGARK